MSTETQLKERLLQTDGEFQQLAAKHHDLDSRLATLIGQPHLSAPEELEKVTLKKRKLQVKDQMEQILRRGRTVTGSGPDADAAPAAGG
ncbi:MAG: YdcH family protein [Vicinamibacterales bacterium]|jgi:uncharacterized protein YdcH (DUF465 family)|nr:hypothetical protein [Acidobacteriota bacterium]MDP6373232.1 YdcH family protein [Vicinamibacterales bacterium]MDP6608482.1 YdcH family protein [Vicinamibacterales bacterium]HAK56345.1 hypothetical protein [Acidobacteriota bacterium]|tara:strand:- start:522 stop:788 length:267 start_codon:yes stop_codon:yes gene_type:complete